MWNLVLTILILCALCSSSNAQKKHNYYDGPYISVKGDDIKLQWIANGKVKDSTVHKNAATTFKNHRLPTIDLSNLDFKKDAFIRYDSVDQFVALSDIHGQYDLFIKLIKAQKVIDENNNWIYGDGHLVIVGDIFDRGKKVIETLWFLFFLEKQAEANGGKVHVLLGNHELMVLHNDVRYIDPKYRYTSGAFKTPYNEFFSQETVLGSWLRSKNICTSINDIAFVHGGFSKKVLEKENSLKILNQTFKDNLLDTEPEQNEEDGLLSLLFFDNGPLWYRGYADPSGFNLENANEILNLLNVRSIVVGHTSMPRIVSLHNNKILLIDSSIKFGKTGEVLVYRDSTFYRGQLSGDLILAEDKTNEDSSSPFQYIYNVGDKDLVIKIITDLDELIENKEYEPYQPAQLIAYHNSEFNRSWDIRLRARGNMRKKICHLPPLKIDFKKNTLDYLGFQGGDKLKVVLPCNDTRNYQQGLYKEYLVYKLYEQIDSLALRTKLIDLVFEDNGKAKYEFTGFFIETEEEYQERNDLTILEKGIITSGGIERSNLLKFAFFQYMIMNNDWSFYNRHNVEFIKCKNYKVPLVVPYDFDYAGIVNQDYAMPTDNLGMKHLREANFRCKDVTIEEMKSIVELYNSKKDALLKTVENANYLDKRNKSQFLSDITRFYKKINDEGKWKKKFLNK